MGPAATAPDALDDPPQDRDHATHALRFARLQAPRDQFAIWS